LKIAHISDVHIRNYRYHNEYESVFEQLYKKLKKLKPDIIINTGDTAHTKLNVSPSYFHVTARLFERLADIAPYHVILGNHDLNLRNLSKIDAVTPIVEALNHPNLHLHKYSAEVDLGNGHTLNVLSILDPDQWTPPSDPSKISIALYHGSVTGVVTDTGYTLNRGDIDMSTLKQYDYALLGDIHKTNQFLDKNGKIRYPGSLVQQNFGETNDKGFLLWNIRGKDDFTVKHYKLENPRPFITVNLTARGKVPSNLKITEGARLRVVSSNALPLDVIRRSIDIVKTRFKPESVTYLSRATGAKGNSEEIINGMVEEDLRDIAVQEELMDEYLQEYQVDSNTLEQIFELNRKYNKQVEEEEEVTRNINWSLRRFEWSNLFNYGEGNYIDFSQLEGVIGILGKNFSGKSSVIDSLLYTIYNSTSKNERKNLNVINQNKEEGTGCVEIEIGNNTYTIGRTSTKYERKSKGNLTTEARTEVSFVKADNTLGSEEIMDGETRAQTDKNIRRLFGNLDDFLLTSMASQLGSLAYINEGSTKRKEILAKFLDLEIFEKKYKKAKDDASDLRVIVKRLRGREFEKEFKEARTELARIETKIMNRDRKCQDLQCEIDRMIERKAELDTLISSIPAEAIDVKKINTLLREGHSSLDDLRKQNKDLNAGATQNTKMLNKINDFVESFDLDDLKDKKTKIDQWQEEILSLESEIGVYELKLKNQTKKGALLNEVPCGSEFSHCKFIKDAYSAIEEKNKTKTALSDLRISRDKLEGSVGGLEPSKVEEYLDKYSKVLSKQSVIRATINDSRLAIEKNKTEILKSEHRIKELEAKKEEYDANRDAIENLEQLSQERSTLEADIVGFKEAHTACKEEVLELYKENGSLEQRLTQIENDQEYFQQMEKQYSAYDLFLTCMNANGISYDIIKKRLPIINEEVSKILTSIVDFEIMFVNEGDKLDILIKHPGYDPRPVELGSGAEKTIAAMAIRLALLRVSTLPKGDIFVLDEPGTALDAENMEGFVRILEMVKTQFKTVLLVSHLDTLKDIVDKQIIIDKEDGYAKITEG